MKVEIQLEGNLYWYQKDKISKKEIEVEDGIKLRELLALLEIPDHEVQLAIVNGEIKELDYIIKSGDKIQFLPVIAGG
ncbi:MAG: ThiS family [Thermosediminibacterales bacterium]|nr:ThiS family [Thermosediminibacterales bacterium]